MTFREKVTYAVVRLAIGLPVVLLILLQSLTLSLVIENRKQIDDEHNNITTRAKDRWTGTDHKEYEDKEAKKWDTFKQLNPDLLYPKEDDK